MWPITLFILSSVAVLLGSVFVIAQRRAFYSALALSVTIIGTAGLFALLRAPFLATLQILIYAGAIMTLFLFVVWMLGVYREAEPRRRIRSVVLGFATVVIGSGVLGFLVLTELKHPVPAATDPDIAAVQTFTHALFDRFVYPFELTSLLFIVAIVAVLYLTRTRSS